MKITEVIADTLLQLLDEQGGTIQIGRNELANKLGCVPSQINYVITSRFTNAQGYIVESRRGGGGFIKIIKVNHSKEDFIIHIINSIGDRLDEATAREILNTLYQDGIISSQFCQLILAVVADANFKTINDTARLRIRANLFKTMLINVL